ncbi:MAG: hypothetical protein AB8G96_07790 [Phycisphaerales bacterium]
MPCPDDASPLTDPRSAGRHAPNHDPHRAHDQLDARVHALESALSASRGQSRRWRVAATIGGVALAASLLTGMRNPVDHDSITVRAMQVVDAEGRVVMTLGSDDAGGRLDVWSTGASNALRLGVNPHGGDINVWTRDGDAAAGLWATGSGGRVGTWDSSGTRRTVLTSDEAGSRLELEDAQVPASPRRTLATAGALEVSGDRGRARLGTDAGAGTLHLGGSNPSAQSFVARGTDSSAALRFETRHGQAFLQLDDSGPQLNLAGPNDSAGVRLATGARGRPDGLARMDVLTQGRVVGRLAARDGAGGDVRLFDGRGRQSAALAANAGGGLLNLFNPREVAVVRAGSDPQGRGGVLDVLNLRGLPVISARTDADGAGEFSVADVDARRTRVLRPHGTPDPVRATRARDDRD